MSPGDSDSYSETVTQTQGADVRISANAYLPIKKLQSSTVHTEKFPEECEECEHPSCGFVDPDGDPCQLFGTRVTTTTQSAFRKFDLSCIDEEGEWITGYESKGTFSMNATIITTDTCEGGSIQTSTQQSGSSNESTTTYFCPDEDMVFGTSSCFSTLTNDGWSGTLTRMFLFERENYTISTPCIEPTETTTTVTYSNPIDRCCDGYAPVGPYCQCEYIGS
jgi:hypothetical protein